MPELPEVEILKRQLLKAIVGKKIAAVKVLREKSFKGDPKNLIGKKVEKIERVAKIIIIKFFGSLKLLIHLKLTGQLVFEGKFGRTFGGHPTLDWVKALPSKHTRVIIEFIDGSKLFFNDLRVFGWLKVVKNQTELEKEIKGFSGIEPLRPEFTPQNLSQVLSRTSRPVKIVLMDQSLIGGVGNIYASDALWLSKINPVKSAKSLTGQEINDLHKAIEKVISLGIKYGGASENTYRQLDGQGGSYQEHFLVYKRQGKSCFNNCGEKIKRISLGGRGTWFCPKCQKENC